MPVHELMRLATDVAYDADAKGLVSRRARAQDAQLRAWQKIRRPADGSMIVGHVRSIVGAMVALQDPHVTK
jgi:hypothetical protein